MDAEKEKALIVGVVDRLAKKFPGVDRERVEMIVQTAYQDLADRPLRDYIAILVEHESKSLLRAESVKPVT
ncbi:MAG TPA: hypothetical protein VEX88_01185 [Glaciibacter sp.]|nr:hypothetical protein [Glaciibacter sp.]